MMPDSLWLSLGRTQAMDAIELLRTRASNGKLGDDAPDPETLKLVLDAAARAPDHAALRPLRVRFVRGAALARFGELMAESLLAHNPGATAEVLERARRKAMRAPLVMVVAAVIREHPRVPEIEQVVSVGASAYAMLLALHARGYGAIWRTGSVAYDSRVKRALGFEESDVLVGFIYTGRALRPAAPLARPHPEEFAAEWLG